MKNKKKWNWDTALLGYRLRTNKLSRTGGNCL